MEYLCHKQILQVSGGIICDEQFEERLKLFWEIVQILQREYRAKIDISFS